MNQVDLENQISEDLKSRTSRVVNRNAFGALFGAFGGPTAAIASLGKIFFGRAEAIDNERHRIERGYILDLLCSIDESILKIQDSAKSQGIVLDGFIETYAKDADEVIGVDITGDAEPVTFNPGFRAKTDTSNVKKVTGLKIDRKKDNNL